jgi:hypothetical protein
MEEKTPRFFNRKIADGPPIASGRGNNNSDRMRILGAASSEFGGYDNDEKKESEMVDTDASGRFRKARGSGWIENSHTGLSSDTPNTRNYSAAQSVLEKLQQEVATKPAYQKSSHMAKIQGSDAQEQPGTPVRYKFVAVNKSPSQIKKEKQKKWKQKMKIAQERKLQEKKALDEGSTIDAGGQFGRAVISCVLDNVEKADFFKKFTRCGDLVEDESVFEEAWSAASSVATSDEDVSNVREVPRGRSQVPRRTSESSASSMSRGSSISTTDQEGSPSPPASEKFDAKPRSDSAPRSNAVASQAPMKPAADSFGRVSSPVNQSQVSHLPDALLSPTQSPPSRQSIITSSVYPSHRASCSRHSASTMTTRPPAPSRERNFIHDFMDDIKSMGESMLWHQETSVMNPTMIAIHLKKGFRCFDGTFCAPRLTWKDEKRGDDYDVDLFDIVSLKKADTLELANFPYAMPGRTVCMKISTGRWFIFEARSEEDAYRFVRGVRWLVSRLAFNLVIGNVDVSCELLDLGLVQESSSVMEFDWSRAMDDVADQLVEKTLLTTMI